MKCDLLIVGAGIISAALAVALHWGNLAWAAALIIVLASYAAWLDHRR